MPEFVLKKSAKLITDCFSFPKEGTTLFRVEFVDYRRTGETYEKDGKTKEKLEKYFRFIFIDKENLPENLKKLDDKKICQELKGKSVLITISIGDK